MRDFRDLIVWQQAHQLTLDVYRASSRCPSDERVGLIAQLRRSSASIATNIAEGCGRDGERELARFVAIAAGSASETEYSLLLASDLGYLPGDVHADLHARVNEVKKMLRSFHDKLTANG